MHDICLQAGVNRSQRVLQYEVCTTVSDLHQDLPGSEEILNRKGTQQSLALEGESLRNLDKAVILQLQRRGLLL